MLSDLRASFFTIAYLIEDTKRTTTTFTNLDPGLIITIWIPSTNLMGTTGVRETRII